MDVYSISDEETIPEFPEGLNLTFLEKLSFDEFKQIQSFFLEKVSFFEDFRSGRMASRITNSVNFIATLST